MEYNSFNFCVGHNAGINITTGHHNILIGENSGKHITSESFVMCIAGLVHQMKDEQEYEYRLKGVKELLFNFSIGLSINNTNTNSLIGIVGGINSTAIGYSALSNYRDRVSK